MVTDTIMPPVHPGEILLTEFLEPLAVSPALYIPASAHRAATGDEIPDDAYRMEPLELLGGWDFNFDDQREIKQRLPQLTALCWCGPHGS